MRAPHGFAGIWSTRCGTERDSVTLCLEANVLTMEKFPFAFKLFSTFRLEGVTVHHDIRVENDGGEVMPFAFGYHPAFLCPFDAAHKAEDYVLRFDTPQTPTVIETGRTTAL
jgi:galactose mutarotase-like enzyme